VFYAEVHALFDVAIADDLVDDDTDGMRGDVVHDSSPSVVELVGHALLLRGVCLDVDNISDTIRNKECRNFDVAMFFEAPREHMARTRPVTVRVRHFDKKRWLLVKK